MLKIYLVILAIALAAPATARTPVVTFSKADLASAIGAGCNVQARGNIRIHRNAAGNMIYLVAEGQRESILYAQSQACNEISSDTLDLWRIEKSGEVVAQLANRFDGRRLLLGTEGDGIHGQRFDVERTGKYLVVSHGDVSSLAAVDRPYRRLLELTFDAQRIFLRQGGLLVVGNNKQTQQLEARTVSMSGGQLTAGAPLPVGSMPAGVRVLDYAEGSDELLLGGLDASKQTSFVVVDLATGAGSAVETARPGDETGLFIADRSLRARLTGGNLAAPVQQQGPSQQQNPGQGQPGRKRGFFGLFGKKGE